MPRLLDHAVFVVGMDATEGDDGGEGAVAGQNIHRPFAPLPGVGAAPGSHPDLAVVLDAGNHQGDLVQVGRDEDTGALWAAGERDDQVALGIYFRFIAQRADPLCQPGADDALLPGGAGQGDELTYQFGRIRHSRAFYSGIGWEKRSPDAMHFPAARHVRGGKSARKIETGSFASAPYLHGPAETAGSDAAAIGRTGDCIDLLRVR